MDTPERLEEKVRPIMDKQMLYLRENFTQEFGGTVNHIVESKLEQSKEQLLDVIYPVLGQMITKFIRLQFQALKDALDPAALLNPEKLIPTLARCREYRLQRQGAIPCGG